MLAGAYTKGDPLALSPRNKVTITGTYTLPLPESVGAVSFGATFTHTDSMFGNPSNRFYFGCNGTANTYMPNCQTGAVSDPATVAYIQSLSRIQSTDLLNLNFNWNNIAGAPVDLALFATNVTKEKYYNFYPGLVSGTGFETASVGAPRMYGMSLKYHFGM